MSPNGFASVRRPQSTPSASVQCPPHCTWPGYFFYFTIFYSFYSFWSPPSLALLETADLVDLLQAKARSQPEALRAVDLVKSLLGKGGMTDFQVRQWGIRRTWKSALPSNQPAVMRRVGINAD